MSKKEPIKIEIEKTLNVEPEDIYITKVIKSGNGAIISSFKRYIGKEVIIIMADKIKKKKKSKEDDVVDATEMAYEFRDKKEVK